MKRTDLQNISNGKLESAEILANHGRWANAYYLAGYSIELALKACVAKFISADTIPDKNLINKVYTHNIGDLLGLAGLKAEFDSRKVVDLIFAANWGICCEWSPESRYKDITSAEATVLLGAISHRKHGVLPWIKTYW
ncbi:MAG: HEPN domain-containing protein [Pseudomonadota bacterium]